jgi:lysyl-tRNA synthetase class I
MNAAQGRKLIYRDFAMVASTHAQQSSPSIPHVACARCGSRMELKTIEPVDDGDSTITFSCGCGHQYQVSQRAFAAIARDSSDRW